MKGTIVERDGKLCVRYANPLDSEPTLVVLYWAIEYAAWTGYGERPSVGDVATYSGGGVWRTQQADNLRSTGTVTTAKGDAFAVERFPIPAPKSKLPTRYHQGSWQKLLKRGWVHA